MTLCLGQRAGEPARRGEYQHSAGNSTGLFGLTG